MFDWTKTNIPKPQNLAECEESGKLYSRLWVVPSFMYKYTSGNFPSIFIYLIAFNQQRHDFYQWLVCSAFKSRLGYGFVLCFSIFFIYLFLIFIPSVDRTLLYILYMTFSPFFVSQTPAINLLLCFCEFTFTYETYWLYHIWFT